MTTKGKITLSTYFFLLFFVGCTTAALVQRRILREISAETLAPQPADANTIAGGSGEDRGGTTSSTSTPTTLKPLCSYSEPCGWAVYEKYTRTFQYYMDNVCRCPSHKHCHRTGDDLTNNAYVYTCIQEEINETIAWVHPPPPPTPTHR
ncbi:hypothetical protein LSTR_LSTR011032 [Laodelphax striatellus]|uniref:Uncharacterized protein n=1 Tax=Laodelphax striatellus TaxID=195883 RepID=A0A482XCV1_LAOST|nr:hypothetical protein LSTR_LSTR011032 [Laodelphax striatellus]